MRVYDTLHVLDFGPLYRAGESSGIITREPPIVRSGAYGVLEFQVDSDGNDIGGVRSAFLKTPVGTYTGWNLGRKDRLENGMCNLQAASSPSPPPAPNALPLAIPGSRSRSAIPRRRSMSPRSERRRRTSWARRYLLPEDAKLLNERAGVRGRQGRAVTAGARLERGAGPGHWFRR